MKKPNVQLKNLSFFEGHDGYGMNADIWINGVKCMHVHDDAWGGCYDYYDYAHNSKDPERIKQLIADLNAYIETLPPEPYEFGGVTKHMKVDLDTFINNLAIEEQEKKEQKKLERMMKDCILVGIPNASRFMRFKFKKPLNQIPKTLLQAHVARIKKEHCTDKGDGSVILNTNLEALGIKV